MDSYSIQLTFANIVKNQAMHDEQKVSEKENIEKKFLQFDDSFIIC